MGRIKLALLFMLMGLPFIACEKDDICVDANTPLLVIRFYDFENQTEFKAVTGLRVIGIGNVSTINTFGDRTSLDSIGVPLKIDVNTTTFNFISGSADDENGLETGNNDNLTFTYTTKEDFKSRACGFIVTYEDLTDALESDADNWIKEIIIDTTIVENSASAHVKIFH